MPAKRVSGVLWGLVLQSFVIFPAAASSMSDLVGDKFYQVSERTEQGPTIRAGLDYGTPRGIYASTNAIFRNEGFMQDLSTGYRTSLQDWDLGLAYNATQLQFENVDHFSGVAQLNANYRAFSYRYSSTEGYQDQEWRVQLSLLGGSLLGKLKHTEEATQDGMSTNTQRALVAGTMGRGTLQLTRTDRAGVRTHDYLAHYALSDTFSSKFHAQTQGENRSGEADLTAVLEKDLRLTLRIAQNQVSGRAQRRVHSLAVDKRYKHTQLEFAVSDALPDMASSAFLIKYKKQIVF